MTRYITYDIEALEELKLSQTNVQTDSEHTIDFITGSSIRGAYIYRYISRKGVSDINAGEHREKLLKNGLRFLNAYPEKENMRSAPFPKCYFATKDDMKLFKTSGNSIDIKSGLGVNLGSDQQKARLSEFATIKDGIYTRVSVGKTSNLHINKSGKKNKLFRYEAIKRGQIFKGIVVAENQDYAKEVKELLEDSIVYIGGSKGSGYGKCRITSVNILDANPELESFETLEADRPEHVKEICLLAMSDIIYRNELGEYKLEIEPEYLKRKLGLESVKFVDSAIDTNNISSFNNKWGCRTPQVTSIKAGSIFKYKVEGKVDKEKLKELLDNGIGSRRSEGFGRVLILSGISDGVMVKPEKSESGKAEKLDCKLEGEELEMLQYIADSIYEERVENSIGKAVLQLDESISSGKQDKASQWGNWKGLFNYIKTESPESGIQKFENYYSHIMQKRKNSYKHIKGVGFKGGSLGKFFAETVPQSEDIGLLEERTGVKQVRIGNVCSKADKEFAYSKNIKILEELCRYQIRKEKSDE